MPLHISLTTRHLKLLYISLSTNLVPTDNKL